MEFFVVLAARIMGRMSDAKQAKLILLNFNFMLRQLLV